MKQYIIRKTGTAIVTAVLVLLFVFIAARLTGNPFEVMYPDGMEPGQLEQFNEKYGLDKSYTEQFVYYVKNVLRGDFGNSLMDRRPVTEIIFLRLGQTLQLGAFAFVISIVAGISLGIALALYRGHPIVNAVNQLMSLLYAVPGFIIAIFLMLLFSFHLNVLPSQGGDTWQHFVMPTICLSVGPIISLARHVQNSIKETLTQDYIRTAVAMGVGKAGTIFHYAFRNALIPALTMVGMVLVDIISGSMVIETVFSWPGIGSTLVGAVMDRDYPVMQFSIILLSSLVILVTYLLDITYLLVDPRIQEKEGA